MRIEKETHMIHTHVQREPYMMLTRVCYVCVSHCAGVRVFVHAMREVLRHCVCMCMCDIERE